MTAVAMDVSVDPVGGVDEARVRQLAARARAEDLKLTGEGGLLARLTKVVFESALEGEMAPGRPEWWEFAEWDAAQDGGYLESLNVCL